MDVYMMLSTDFFDCFDIIQKTDILITIGNTSAETKDLSCKIAYNNIESRFPFFFFISTLLLPIR